MRFGFRAILCSLVFALAAPAWAAPYTLHSNAQNDAHDYFAIDAGAFADNIGSRLGAPSGYSSEASSISGFLRLRPGFHLGGRFYFEPSLGFVLPWRTNVDGSTMIFPVQFSLDFSVPLVSFLSVRLGPGIFSQIVYGSGGVVQLNNGTGVSNFAAPSGVSISFSFTADLGFEFQLSRTFSINLDGYVLEIASQARRTYQASASLGVKL